MPPAITTPLYSFPKELAGASPSRAAHTPQPEVADGIGQDRGRGREAEEETTIAQPEIGLGAADAQPRAVTLKPVAFHKFIRGLFSLSQADPRILSEVPRLAGPAATGSAPALIASCAVSPLTLLQALLFHPDICIPVFFRVAAG